MILLLLILDLRLLLSAIPTDYMNEFVKSFEESMEAKKKVVEKKKKGVEKFCEEVKHEDSNYYRHPLGSTKR